MDDSSVRRSELPKGIAETRLQRFDDELGTVLGEDVLAQVGR